MSTSMEYRKLGNTGISVSGLCFGTMSFGGDANAETSRAMFDACRDAGVNLFDCADVYAKGESERLLGSFIKDCRDEIVLVTKAFFPTGPGVNSRGSSRYHLARAVEASLKRLRTDHIDVYFLHRFDDETPLVESLRALEYLVASGKVLHVAVSNFAAWQTARALGLAELHRFSPIVAVQPMYNLVKRQAEVEILPLAHAENLAVLPYSPLGGGLLSGKYGREQRPKAGRLVRNRMYTTRYGAADNFAIAEDFTNLAQEMGHHPAALALAWVASHPAVTAPLVGARNLEQLMTCLTSAQITLSTEERAQISALSPKPPPATDRNEETTSANYGAQLQKPR